MEKSVLMEIGYSRTRPYTQLEERPRGKDGHRSGRRWFLKQRTRVRNLSGEEFALVYPLIAQCMTAIVLECREKWGQKRPWFVIGPGEVERGIHFTISHADELLHQQFVREDARYRGDKYIRKHARWIRWLFGRYKSSYYTPKQMKSFARVQCVAEMLSQNHYTPFYRMVLCGYFKEGSRTRTILESIMEVFNIDISLTDLETHTLEPALISLPWLINLRCYRPPQQPAVHARNSSIFELTLERSYREKNEIPF
ncbi:MAG: hypothetical protein ACYC75_02605 [Minisyncoccota bacterium]